jgi:hypothetical protein
MIHNSTRFSEDLDLLNLIMMPIQMLFFHLTMQITALQQLFFQKQATNLGT